MNRFDCSLRGFGFFDIHCLAVSEPLADDTTDQPIGALFIANAKRCSVAISEIVFSEVSMKVRLADVEIAAVDAAFQDRKEPFGGVGGRLGSVAPLSRPI